jgi:hypothetical protein
MAVGAGLTIHSTWQERGEPDPSKAWTWRSDEHGFSLRLPSDNWKQRPDDQKGVRFTHRGPAMVAMIARVRPAQSHEDFERIVREELAQLGKHGPEPLPRFTEGVNDAGNPYHFAAWPGTSPNGAYYAAISLTWSKAQQVVVVLVFEGQYRMQSETGIATERQAFEKSARAICLSVE